MDNKSIEYTMNTLATMVVLDRSAREGRKFEEVFSEFRKSNTFAMLYDSETGLWMNGPDYISEEYDIELARSNS